MKGLPLDARSDEFSFGVILAEIASGHHPFRKPSMLETLSSVLRDPPELSADTPKGLATVLRRLMAKTAAERYLSIADVRTELSRLEIEPDKLRPPARAGWKWPVFAASAILVGFAAYLALHSGFSRPHAVRSIAVLPLDNYSGDPKQDYFAEGMTDELTADLATISQLRVSHVVRPCSSKASTGRPRLRSAKC